MLRFLSILVAGVLAFPVLADDESASLRMGDDTFIGGRSVVHSANDTDDLFMAGETVSGSADITGSAHLAGRAVSYDGAVGGDVYAAGEEIEITGDVSGDVTVIGRALTVGSVGGDLRIAGSELHLTGDVGGYAMIAGEDVRIDGRIAGDLRLAADDVDWGSAATIGGRLILYEEDPGELEVPGDLVPSDRIERLEIEEWEGPQPPSLRRAVASFVLGVIVVAGLAALIAALVPDRLADMRRLILDRPFHTLWLGFLTQSAVIGAGVVFALTIVGLLFTPAMLLLAVVGGFCGYVVAAYAFGVGLLTAFGKPEPEVIGDRALAAGVGALSAGIIGLVPFFGWLFVLALVLAGIGAITLRVIRPVFFADMAE
ncbi:hypothetical protein [Marivita hallyeonensis]|uniref:DUF8173 domain-containing protein n=1 Tax=Marivita hallyeonensis TaxID=996342 RepID=A0A1M5USU1_9RHOB|nr:hypothetical protein [Marivita hallyeonensis]SHH65996.1 hypothetical protein SAMN05443551_2783 [Marivita hallyeonensis]